MRGAVTLVDRVNPGDPEQTSYGNAGLLASSAIVPISSPGIWKNFLTIYSVKIPTFY